MQTVPTSGRASLAGTVTIRETLRLTGPLTITGGAIRWWGENTPFAPIIDVPTGTRLTLRGVTLVNAEWNDGGKWVCTRAIVVDGGVADLQDTQIIDGMGVEVIRGDLIWIRGGGAGLQRYLAKLGDADNDPARVARRVTLRDLTCDGTTTEAVVRAQGCDRLHIENCTLLQKDAAGRHDKGALALRLARGCTISGGEFDTLELGWRTPSSVGESDERYGAANPNFIFIGRSTINGSVRNCGNSAVAVQSCRFTGLDRRGFGEKTAMIEQTHKTWRGEIMHDSCTIPNGWKIGDGVQKKSENPKRWMQIWANANAD